jgi:hypothetical protein
LIKIDPLGISVGEAVKAHPYPFQTGYQTQELIQGAIFCLVVANGSCGAYIWQQDALDMLESQIKQID